MKITTKLTIPEAFHDILDADEVIQYIQNSINENSSGLRFGVIRHRANIEPLIDIMNISFEILKLTDDKILNIETASTVSGELVERLIETNECTIEPILRLSRSTKELTIEGVDLILNNKVWKENME